MRTSFCTFLLLLLIGVVSALSAQNPVEELSVPGHNLFVNQINSAHRFYPQYSGEGITISIKEFRFDSSDVDFKGRYVASGVASNILSIHASIVATLAAGAGTTEPTSLGVAPGARICSSSFVGLKPDQPADYSQNNITVQSHAYGSEIDYQYSDLAQAFDQSTIDNPSLVHVFSAGNKGTETTNSGQYSGVSGFATITGSYKMAKNILTIGAVDSFNQVPVYSSKGPDYAGRLKPDLVAFGAGGSSESAALVSGAAALVQQVYLSRLEQLPRAELVRATLLNSATDIAAPGPDFVSGYGNLNLKEALRIAKEGLIWQDSVQEGVSETYVIPATASDQSLKITLAWNDPPAEIGTSSPLINDLDIQVMAPDGQIWYPFVLSSFPSADSLATTATRRLDTLNNIEQVYIPALMPGNYTVRVNGRRVRQESLQHFALAADLLPIHFFEWSCPVKNDPFVPGETAVLRWTSNWPESNQCRISWKNIDATEWAIIDSAVLLQQNYYAWKPTGGGLAQVKAQIGTTTFLSDTFLIAPRLQLKVGFDCTDSTFLHWENTAPNTQYQIWGLGDRYLEPLFITSDTFSIFSKAAYPQVRFAVSPVNNGIYGTRSAAPEPDKQGVGCYISRFFAELVPEEELVQIGLQLGTIYNAESIEIEKQVNGIFHTIFTETADRSDYNWEDESPNAGINRYRARVLLRDGQVVYSKIIPVYIGGSNGVRIFPNPFKTNDILHVVLNSPEENTVFQLFDVAGRKIFSSPIEEIHTPVQLPPMQAGVYLWQIGEIRGKLVAW